jgi:hypothetical protein
MNDNPLSSENREIAYNNRSHPDYVSNGMELISLINTRLPQTANIMNLIKDLISLFEVHKILEVLLSKLSLERYRDLIRTEYDIDISMIKKVDQTKLNNFRVEYLSELKSLSDIEKMKTLPLPQFMIENVDIIYNYRYSGTLYTLFDQYVVDTTVPLIAYNHYYKVYSPLYHRLGDLTFRLDAQPETLQFVVDNQLVKINSDMVLSIPSTVDPSLLRLNPIRKESETNLRGYYAIESLNQYVIADIITVDPSLSEYLVINDQVKSTATSVQINYQHPYSDEKLESTLRIFGGTARLIVRKATSMLAVEQFQYLFERVLGLYTVEVGRIGRVYSQYGFTFQPLDKKVYLKSMYPKIFDAGYSRRCQPAIRVPIVIEDEKDALIRNRTVMRFPMDDEVTQSRMFICPDEVFKYPGLIRTKANAFGFQPCCFKRNQSNTKKYREYFEQEQIVTDAPTYIKRTDKVIDRGEYGLLPASMIRYYFDSLGIEVRRKGITLGPNSFIECIESVLPSGRTPKQIRSSLTELLPLFTHTMYDVSLDNIRKFIMSEEYFDPELTIGVLEAKYNCNIIVLVKDSDRPDGEMMLPRSAQGYRHYRRDGPIIVVYCHTGSEKDRLSLPHCELLVWMDDGSENTTFNEIEMVSQLEVSIIGLPIPMPTFKIIGQVVDSMGNIRVFMVAYEDQILQLHTPPLPPLAVEMLEYDAIQGCDQYRARDFFTTYGTYNESIDGVTYGTIGGIEYKLYHNNITFDDTLEISIRNEQSARKLLNWCQWHYSMINRQTNVTPDEFFSDYTEINPNVDLVSLGPFFNENSGMIRGRRLQLPSQMISDKLKLYLMIQLVRRPAYIASFHEKTVLDNYYLGITDFKVDYNYVVTKSTQGPTIIPLVPPSEVLKTETLPVATIITSPDEPDQVYIAT